MWLKINTLSFWRENDFFCFFCFDCFNWNGNTIQFNSLNLFLFHFYYYYYFDFVFIFPLFFEWYNQYNNYSQQIWMNKILISFLFVFKKQIISNWHLYQLKWKWKNSISFKWNEKNIFLFLNSKEKMKWNNWISEWLILMNRDINSYVRNDSISNTISIHWLWWTWLKYRFFFF